MSEWQTSSFLLKHSTWRFSLQMKSGVFPTSSMTLLSRWCSLKTETGSNSEFFSRRQWQARLRMHSPVFHVVQLCWHRHTCTWTKHRVERITRYSYWNLLKLWISTGFHACLSFIVFSLYMLVQNKCLGFTKTSAARTGLEKMYHNFTMQWFCYRLL